MQVEAFDPISPARGFVLRTQSQTLAAIVDGAGSWGSGREAADWTRRKLAARWGSARSWRLGGLADDISTVAFSTPTEFRDPEFGWSFSVTCLLASDGFVECVAAGFYRVDVCAPTGVSNVFRPEMLRDRLAARGTPPETAAHLPHASICLGPFVGEHDRVALTFTNHAVTLDEVIVVTHAARYDLDGIGVPQSARALTAFALRDAFPSPVLLLKP